MISGALSLRGLNESPSEKEGKSSTIGQSRRLRCCLNESPSEKEGKSRVAEWVEPFSNASMKALPKRKGNTLRQDCRSSRGYASMKALPKRKGNFNQHSRALLEMRSLNESPSEKEGKSDTFSRSMSK